MMVSEVNELRVRKTLMKITCDTEMVFLEI